MDLRKPLWISVSAFMVFLMLRFLRLFQVLGSEADILINWFSTVSLTLCGVFLGMFISEKRIQVRGMLLPFFLFALGFFAAPFVGVGILMLVETFTFIRGIEPIIVGGSVVVFLLLYMGLWFWLKKKGIFKFEKN